MQELITFENDQKYYPFYHHITGGLKNLLFNMPRAIRDMKSQKFTALEDISFKIMKGESVGFIGRNGAGKSTTLGLIAQVLKPNKGRISIGGRISPLLELGGGFHPELTGLENIKLNGILLGLTRKQVNERLEEIIEFAELGDFINHPIRTYSSGMLARLGFSVIAHLDPEILLVDEVLAVGDANFQQKCLNKINSFKEAGVTIIIVSHSIRDILNICDRVIWIENHNIKMDGPASEVTDEYIKYFDIQEEMVNQH